MEREPSLESEDHKRMHHRLKQLGPDLESRREKLYEQIETTLQFGHDLRDLVESISPEESQQDIESKLESYMDSVKAKFPQESEDIERIQELRSQREEHWKSYDVLRSRDEVDELNEEEENQVRIIMEKTEEITDEIGRLSEGNITKLILNLDNMTADLIAKNIFIKESDVKDWRTVLSKWFLEELSSEEFDFNQIEKVMVKPFSIILISNPDYFEKLSSSSSIEGLFLGGTPFILIKRQEDQSRMNDSIKHEEIHCYTDAANLSRGGLNMLFDERIERYNALRREGAPQWLIDSAKKLLIKTKAWRLLDDLHFELVAAIPAAEQADFRASKKAKTAEEQLLEELFGGYGLSTVEKRTKELGRKMREIIKTAENEGDQILSQHIKQLSDDFHYRWFHTIETMRYVLDEASALSEDAYFDVHMLFYFLRPSQYGHIEEYLVKKYGNSSASQS